MFYTITYEILLIAGIMTSLLVSVAKGTITYDNGCGVSLGCFHDCSPSCTYILTWKNGTGSTVDFVLKVETGNSDIWLGIGLSSDKHMGTDSVTMCFYQSYIVTAKQTYNSGKSNSFLTPDKALLGKGFNLRSEGLVAQMAGILFLTNPMFKQPGCSNLGLSAVSGSYTNGVLECKFTRSQTDTNPNFFDLKSEWYLIFANGPFSATDHPSKHRSSPIVSSTKVNFLSSFDVSGTPTSDKTSLAKAHGSMMMFAWITTSTIGIAIAMWFKPVWSETKIGGLHIWFQIHRVCMTLTVLLTSIAFIIIFVANDGKYSEIAGSAIKKLHPVFGIITFILAVINPFMALLRPKTDHEKRWIFNLCHGLIGIGANTFGVVAIFGGVFMMIDGGHLPDYAAYLVYVFVVWDFVLSVVLEILSRIKKTKGKTASMEMTTVGESSTVSQTSKHSPVFIAMQLLLGIHILFVVSITIVLIAILGSDGDY